MAIDGQVVGVLRARRRRPSGHVTDAIKKNITKNAGQSYFTGIHFLNAFYCPSSTFLVLL